MTEKDFYPKQQDYWERGQRQSCEVAGSATSDDARCFHSLAADSSHRASHRLVVSVGALVLREKMPKAISGPYLLYCAFALWHFHVHWWLVHMSNRRCRAVRHSSKGQREGVAFDLSMVTPAVQTIRRPMKSRPLLLKVLIGAVAAALCVYAGLYVYKSQRYASAFAETRLGDSPEIVSNRFGAPPNIEFPHSGYFMGFTKFPCAPPCETRLSWNDPTSVFRQQAYYFEFDVNRHLISKTHYQHLDEAYLRWTVERDEAHARSGLDFRTEADRFRAAKVVAVVRLLEPPQMDARDTSWGPLSKFLVLRSWKGPFLAGATITVATSAMCYGPSCTAFTPKQVGQSVMISSYLRCATHLSIFRLHSS